MADPVQRPIGTRDFAPAETHVRAQVAARVRDAFRRFGYREVQTPTFEELALFTAKSGEGVIDELYAFKDKGDRDLTLRPELTAPVMRLYFQEHFNDPKPLKWWYFGNCFRYDRPQAGRYREFWQFGCEQIGAGTPLAYAELLALADACVRSTGLRNRDLYVGHVAFLRAVVNELGLNSETERIVFRLIDKGNREELLSTLSKANVDAIGIAKLTSVLDATTKAEAKLLGHWGPPWTTWLHELEDVFQYLEALGVTDAKLNLGIARGLDYYTGIVFEMHCPLLGAQKQLLGGGGYDLSAIFGGSPTPTMGFGLGFDRTIVALEAEAKADGRALAFGEEPGPAVYFGALSSEALAQVLPLVSTLRAQGVEAELDLLGRKPGAIAKHADAVRARHLVVVGDRDLAAGSVQVKELATGQATPVPLGQLAAWLGQSTAR